MTQKIHTMHAWVNRRRAKHQEPTADEIWQRIKHNWPKLSDEDAEAVFQGAT